MDLSVEFAGLHLKNPVITASGTFGYGVELQQFGDLSQLGGIVVKGLSLAPRKGNPSPRVAETPCGMLNAVGLQNIGVESFLRDKLPLLPWQKTPVIANLYAHSCEEFGELTDMMAGEQGIAAFEVNISCPNVREGGAAFGQDPVQAARVTRAVCQRAGNKPVIVKLSPNVTDITVIARAVEDAGAHGLSLINTLTGMAVDIRTRKPLLGNVTGGLSGPAIHPVALRMVYETCRAVSIPVMGLGGIMCAEDALEFILVGAHAVQVGTGSFTGTGFAFSLAEKMRKTARKMGLDSWDDFRGQLDTTTG
ncbi:dihydroorotate dehydrogenase [Desulfoplanes formicivorans]|uniref:Dihydroorotate dehydrogenase n=1 Tax=Desulfoplanes formicivorans TaxID=1592317 RepID=A0A194AGG5_9BACT|nr:dihydroorotate dehydrogenase [Desulfoplanes formicivorans]GAU08418.1 diguanylate cyclase [Desulfoplanes formicivorans]